MRLTRLELFDYRNFRRLDLQFGGATGVFVGANAQGKSNLLEAVYLLATMRAIHAETDVQMVRRQVLDDVMPAARVAGWAETLDGPLKLEVAVVARPGAHGAVATKTVRVNGVPKRLSDAVGRLTAVLFSADDMEMIAGSPSLRRRYIDITLAQVDPQYAAARARFERVLTQRNHLLKSIREGGARTDELFFWDEELARDGGLIFERRATCLAEMAGLAAEAHASLAPAEPLAVHYQPRLDGADIDLVSSGAAQAAEAYAAALRRGMGRDVAAGMTLQGPHRDDVQVALDGVAASGYASRAQQRTIALSLRLAEARLLLARRGEPPVLLLDDVLSEMDSGRRGTVMRALADMDQMLVTGTDWDRFPKEFLSRAGLFEVEAAAVRPLAPQPASPKTAGL